MKRSFRVEETSVDLDGPVGTGKPAVILGHGAGQGMDSPFMSFFYAGLARSGFLSVRFNFPYMDAGRKVPDRPQKLRAAFAAVIGRVTDEFGPGKILIGGKSMGGRIASYIADDHDRVAGLVFLGYPLHPPGKPDALRDQHLYAISKPMLFVSGTRDTLARRDLLEMVVSRIGDRATLQWIEGGDHSLRGRKSDPDRLPEALTAIIRWAGDNLAGS